jgi:hypothetical protein
MYSYNFPLAPIGHYLTVINLARSISDIHNLDPICVKVKYHQLFKYTIDAYVDMMKETAIESCILFKEYRFSECILHSAHLIHAFVDINLLKIKIYKL